MTRMLDRHAAAWLLFAAAAATSPDAIAQAEPCPNGAPPGWRQVGVIGGSHGIAPVPMCERLAPPEPPQALIPPPHPMQPLLNAMVAELGMVTLAARDLQHLQNDPRFQALRKGYWHALARPANAKPGEHCAVTFFHLNGVAMASGPGGDSPHAAITFLGRDIPSPKTSQLRVVTLKQNGAAPQTIKALHAPAPQMPSHGLVSFTVPDGEALAKGLLDEQLIELEIDAKPVFSLRWHSGAQAKAELTRCLKGG